MARGKVTTEQRTIKARTIKAPLDPNAIHGWNNGHPPLFDVDGEIVSSGVGGYATFDKAPVPLYRFVQPDGASANDRSFKWSLPTQKRGKWVPGEWMTPRHTVASPGRRS